MDIIAISKKGFVLPQATRCGKSFTVALNKHAHRNAIIKESDPAIVQLSL